MPFIQVPPDSTGKLVDTITVTSSQHRQVMVVGDPSSTAGLAPVTSSAGVLVNPSGGSVTLSSAGATQVLTSGPLQVLTSGATVIASGTVTLSSAPAVVAASSGVTQVLTSGPLLLSSGGISQFIPVTTSGINLYTTGGLITDTRRGQTLSFFTITVSCSGGKQLVAASGSNKVKLVSYAVVASSATNITWQSSNTALSGQIFLSSNGGIAIAGDCNAWLMETSAAGNLVLNVNDTSYVTGHGAYFYEV